MKYGEKIVPTRVPRTNELDLDKNFRRLSRSSLIKGVGINGGNFPTNLPSRPIDPFYYSNFFFALFISVLFGKFRLTKNTKNIGRRRFIYSAIAILLAVTVAPAPSSQPHSCSHGIKLFFFYVENNRTRKKLRKKSTLP